MTVKEITERRNALGISKAALGREAGIHPSTMSQIENGRLVPYPTQMERIEAALDRLEAAEAVA